MVDTWWGYQIEKGIKLTRYRIAHHEKHGDGNVAMEDKARLKRQLRHKELRDAKLK